MLATTAVPGDVIVDGSAVFYVDMGDSSIHSVPLGGGPATTLAMGQASPARLAVDGTYVYWSSNLGGAIVRTLENGSGTPQVVASANQPYGLGVDAQYIYWMDQGTSSFLRAFKDGGDSGSPTELLTNVESEDETSDVAVKNGTIYLDPEDGATFYAITAADGSATPISCGFGTCIGAGIAATSSTIYVNGSSTETWLDVSNPADTAYWRLPGSGRPAATVATACGVFVPWAAASGTPSSGVLLFPHSVPTSFATAFNILPNVSVVRETVAGSYLVYSFAGGVAKIGIPQ
jgi:hypothetical protein